MSVILTNRLENWDSEAAKSEFNKGRGRDIWVPGCGGNEVPALIGGTWFLYCFNHKTRKHAYLNMNSDMIITDEEAREIGLG